MFWILLIYFVSVHLPPLTCVLQGKKGGFSNATTQSKRSKSPLPPFFKGGTERILYFSLYPAGLRGSLSWTY
jgi:hypothetical protein